MGRLHFQKVLANHKALLIQRVWRGYVARKRVKALHYGIVLLQSHYRRRKAKEELRQLKVVFRRPGGPVDVIEYPSVAIFQIEARSVTKIKQVNVGLENKIIELQQKLDQRGKDVKVLQEENQRIVVLQVPFPFCSDQSILINQLILKLDFILVDNCK